MSVAFIGGSAQIWDYYVSGPYPPTDPLAPWNFFTQFDLGAVTYPWAPRNHPNVNATPREVWTHQTLGGGGILQGSYKGVQAKHYLVPAGAAIVNIMGNNQLMPNTAATGLDPSYQNPSWKRVQWFTISLAQSAGSTLDDQTGMLLQAFGGNPAGPFWPIAPAVNFNGGFGLTANGTGSWDWQSFGAGVPAPVTETVSLVPFIADPEQLNVFDFVIINAGGGRIATLELKINGVTALTRDWVNAPVLFPLGLGAGFNAFKFLPVFQCGVGGTMILGDWSYRLGRFTPNGQELAS